ncbi:MAG: hypothetical protein HQL28_04350 [Candidatus Omnitrophica bacterium]|nr:hypothetical protein [Candidatus Omnitrophota bacterium]
MTNIDPKEVVRIKIRSEGEVRQFFTNGMKFTIAEKVIVEADRGLEYGEVATLAEHIEDPEFPWRTIRKVIRKVNPWDLEQIQKNKENQRLKAW